MSLKLNATTKCIQYNISGINLKIWPNIGFILAAQKPNDMITLKTNHP